MQQRPQLGITHPHNITAFATVTAVRPTFRQVFLAPEMDRPGPAVTGTAVYLYIINKIGGCHSSFLKPFPLQRSEIFH
jgi:hypothetical protein